MDRSPNIGNLAKALGAAQSQIKPAIKDSKNPFFKSKYADLASVWDACRTALTSCGLAVLQPTSASGPIVTVTTMLASSDGEWISEALTVTAKDASPQAIGSAITYARRYGLAAMVGVAPENEDDDGEAAQPQTAPAQQRPRQQAPPSQQPAPTTQKAAPNVGKRIKSTERKYVEEGICKTGELIAYLERTLSARWSGSCLEWPSEALETVGAICKEFASNARTRKQPDPVSVINAEQIANLESLIETRGAHTLPGLRKHLGLGQGASILALSPAQYEKTVAFMTPLPEVQTA